MEDVEELSTPKISQFHRDSVQNLLGKHNSVTASRRLEKREGTAIFLDRKIQYYKDANSFKQNQ